MKKIYATLTTLFLLQSLLLAQTPGTLDLAFGSAGKACPDFGASGDAAYPVLALPDGSVLLGGGTNYSGRWEFAIAKRLPDGSPDATFGADPKDWIRNPGVTHYGTPSLDLYLNDMALLPSGNIIVVGTATQRNADGSYSDFARAEMFEPNGTRTPGWTFSSFLTTTKSRLATAVQVQSNGYFIVGAVDRVASKLEIGRFRPNGTRDPLFGTNGTISLPITGWWGSAYGVRLALLPDGKILAAISSGATTNGNILLVRLTANGQFDSTFGTSGIATLDVGDNSDIPTSVLPMPDGRVLVTGRSIFDAQPSKNLTFVMRLLSNGTLDPTFNITLHTIGPEVNFAQRGILLPDGKILLSGYQFTSTPTSTYNQAFAVRFLPNGDLDPAFGAFGVHWMSHPSSTTAFSVAALPNGGAVLGGFSISPVTGDDFLLEAIDAAGLPNPGFGTEGIVDLPLDGGVCALQASACLPDGKILVAGTAFHNFSSDLFVGRLLPDGSTDLTFGEKGKALAGFVYSDTDDYGYDMALAPDGKIVVAGYTDSIGGSNTRIAIARFLPNGTLDNSFNGSGKLTADWSLSRDFINAVTVQPDSKVVAAGWYNSKECAVARFLPNGKNDPAFGINGLKNWLIGAEKSEVNAVSILSDGSILAAGEAYFPGSGSQFSITKLKSDGLFDPSFGTGGQATFPLAGTSDAFCNDLTVQADGKILLTGSISLLGDDNGIATLRLLPNGTVDATFGTNGWSLIGVVADVDIPPSASSVKVQPDGKILLAGLGGPLAKTLAARLLPNGSLDPTFGDAGIFLDAPDTLNVSAASSVSLQLDGKIVLAGFFTPDLYNVGPVVYRLISGLSVGVIDRPQAMSQPLIYPNPVRESQVAVEYELPAPSLVRIELLDLQGFVATGVESYEKGLFALTLSFPRQKVTNMKSEQTSPVKDKYKVRNWREYNRSLVERGNISLWLDPSVMRAWRDIPKEKVVGEEQYPACVIQCCLLLGKVYRQPLRQTTGFVRSLLKLMGLGGYKVPDYSTLCRRQGDLPAEVSEAVCGGKKLDIAIDSTGLKVYGEGEWKVRKHGASKRRVWQKMHIGIDIHTQEIISVKMTSHAVDDAKAAADMLEGEKRLRSFWGDGAYDDFHFREVLGPDVRQVIPPPKDAVEHKSSKKKEVPAYLDQRNEAVRFIHEQGREEWKKQSGYHLRSRNETVMFRYKTTFGGKLEARKEANQSTEIILKCKILNRFRQTGMPQAYKVA